MMQFPEDSQIAEALIAAAGRLWDERHPGAEVAFTIALGAGNPAAASCLEDATIAVAAAIGTLSGPPSVSTVNIGVSLPAPDGGDSEREHFNILIAYPTGKGAHALDATRVLAHSRDAIESAMLLGGDESLQDNLIHIDLPTEGH